MKYQMFLIAAFIGILMLAGIRQTSSVQGNQPMQSSCTLLDKGKPPQVINFEHVEKKPGGGEIIWLRLHNNTSCDIIIPTASMKLTKFPDGRFTTDLQDGASAEVYYEFEKKHQTKSVIVGAYGLGDEVIVSRLPSGKSVIFSIPRSHFKQQQSLRVPFKYDWERGPAPGTGLIKHYVYFENQSP